MKEIRLRKVILYALIYMQFYSWQNLSRLIVIGTVVVGGERCYSLGRELSVEFSLSTVFPVLTEV